MLFSSKTEGTRISAILLSATNPRNARMNHGNIFAMEKLFFPFVLLSAVIASVPAFCAAMVRWFIYPKRSTIGTIERVRVSFTIVAKFPAVSEKAYPAATTEDVSFTAVPAQSP